MSLRDEIDIHSAALSTVLGNPPQLQANGAAGDESAVWILDSPTASASIKLELVSAKNDSEKGWVEAVGGIGVQAISIVNTTGRLDEFPAGQDAERAGEGIGQIYWRGNDS